jgi:hypothetical protein
VVIFTNEGDGVVEVRLVDGGLGRIGLFEGFFPLPRFLGRDIGQRRRADRLEGLGQGGLLPFVFRRFGGWAGLVPVARVLGRAFERVHAGRLDRPFSLRRDAVDF